MRRAAAVFAVIILLCSAKPAYAAEQQEPFLAEETKELFSGMDF